MRRGARSSPPLPHIRRRERIPPVSIARFISAVAIAAALVVTSAVAASAHESVPSATQPPAGDITWSVAPANDSGPDGRISLRHEIAPGASATDAIAVTNQSGVAATFTVIAGDGVVGADGAFDIAKGEPTDSGAWISFSGLDGGSLALEPGQTTVLPVAITVPSDALPGDHPAGVVVALSQQNDGTTVTSRIGVRLHLQVEGEIVPKLTVKDTRVQFEPSLIPFAPGTTYVETDIANEGNVRLGAAAAVTSGGPFGWGEAASGSDVVELLPGDTKTIRTAVSNFPLVMAAGDVSVKAVALGDDQIALPSVDGDEFSALAISWTGLALVVVVAGVVTLIIVRRTRSKKIQPVAAE